MAKQVSDSISDKVKGYNILGKGSLQNAYDAIVNEEFPSLLLFC